MANLPDMGVARKIESSEYQPDASGSIFCQDPLKRKLRHVKRG
jgi:hypothetical protein